MTIETVKVYVDAARTKRTRIVNSFGKKITESTDRWRIGVVCGTYKTSFVNSQAAENDSFAAEAYAHIKGLEVAIEQFQDAKHITIVSDVQALTWVTKNDAANRYMAVVKRIAEQRGITVAIGWIAGADNPANEVSRWDDSDVDPATGGLRQSAPPKSDEALAEEAAASQALSNRVKEDFNASIDRKRRARKRIKGHPEFHAALMALKLPAKPPKPGTPAAEKRAQAARTFKTLIGIEDLTDDELAETYIVYAQNRKEI